MKPKTMKNPSEGYFSAKRQLSDALEFRIKTILEKVEQTPDSEYKEALLMVLTELESVRSFVRNGMLWDKLNGE